MYTLVFLSASSFVSKSGVSITVYRLFYKDPGGTRLFSAFYNNSPVIVGGETMSFSDAACLLAPGAKFSIFTGDNNAKVFCFEEV